MAYGKPTISVIMSTFNRKSFLSRSVESILKQTYKDFELILVNNGSTDGSKELCEEYAQADSRIKVSHINKNCGASNGKNKGIDLATGKYLTIVDDDDYCEPQMLQHLWGLANKHTADISMCGSWNDFGNKLEPYFIFDEILVLDKATGLDELLKREKYNVAPPTKLFNRKLFNKIRFKEGVLVDDIHIIYKVFAKASTVVAHGIPLYRFTKHEGNMTNFIQTNKISGSLLEEYLAMHKERVKYLTKRVPEITERVRYSEWSYMIAMCHKIIKYNCKGCENQYNYMKETLKKHYEEIYYSKFVTEKEKVQLKKYVTITI